MYSYGYILKILLKKGTPVIDLDKYLLKNLHQIPDKDFCNIILHQQVHKKHEYILPPNGTFKVENFYYKPSECRDSGYYGYQGTYELTYHGSDK